MEGWIGVDLDGTLAYYDGWPKDGGIGAPIPLMVDRVKQWLAEGRRVKIFTARAWPWGTQDTADIQRVIDASQQIDRITEWCIKHIGQALPITCIKDYQMIELWDDRCIQIKRNTGMSVLDSVVFGSDE